MAVFAIGDIQGCYQEFRSLLRKMKFRDDCDTLWITGDLVNRGHDSLSTLRYVSAMGPSAITVLGNHDLHLLAMAADCALPARAKRIFARYSRRRTAMYSWNGCADAL